MKVGINLCWLVPGDVGGSEQALTRAVRAVAAHSTDVDVALFVLAAFADAHPDLVDRFETHVMPLSRPLSRSGRGRAVRAAAKPARVAGEHLWLPRAVRRAGIDVLHDAGGTAPGRVDVPRVLGIHDIQPLDQPRNFHRLKVAWLRRVLPTAVARSAVVTVPSTFVRDRVTATFDVEPDRVRVVPWCAPPADVPDPGREADLRERCGIPGPYVLLAAITYPHKDHGTVIAAFARIADRHPDVRLVLTGGVGPAEADVAAAIERSGVSDRIVRTGRLGADEVAALMAAARVVVVPSRYEGFGIPALEAMSAGTPVIVADAGSLPEVVGDAGVIVPAGDDAQWAIELHHGLGDDGGRDDRIAAGRARAATFSGERTAGALLDSYAAAYRIGLDGR